MSRSEQELLALHVLDVAYSILMSSRVYAPHLSLVGAYSIQKQLQKEGIDYSRHGRLTYDLDFNVYSWSSLNQVDYVEFQRLLTTKLGTNLQVSFNALKERENSVTYSFKVTDKQTKVTTQQLKIDFSFEQGIKYFDVQPLQVSMVKKLILSNDYHDRRPKDKLDFYLIFTYLYPPRTL